MPFLICFHLNAGEGGRFVGGGRLGISQGSSLAEEEVIRMMVSGGMKETDYLRKSTLLQPCGGNKGCLTPNEHPPLVGHYSPEPPLAHLSPRSKSTIRVPCRVPDDGSQDTATQSTASTKPRIPVYTRAPKRGSLWGSRAGAEGAAADNAGAAGAAGGRRHTGLTPDPPMTTYQRANLEFLEAGAGEREEIASEHSGMEGSRVRDDRSQTSHRSHASGVQSIELKSVRSGKSRRSAASGGSEGGASQASSPLTARALEHLEKVEEEKEKAELSKQRKGAEHGELLFGSPRGKDLPPMTNPRTGGVVRPKHQHLYLPLEEQLKRLVPDLTPATSAPVSDRSHYIDANARAKVHAEERAKAGRSDSGSATARAWYGDNEVARRTAGRDVRVRLATTKMARSRPFGADGKTGEELLDAIDARIKCSAAALGGGTREGAAGGARRTSAGAAAHAAHLQEDARSDKLPVRRLGQKDFGSLLPPKRLAQRGGWDYSAVQNAGWMADEPVDRIQKSRGPSQGGPNIETQMILSPGLLKSRLAAAAERQQRRLGEARHPTARESPCAKAFASIQTMSMQVRV